MILDITEKWQVRKEALVPLILCTNNTTLSLYILSPIKQPYDWSGNVQSVALLPQSFTSQRNDKRTELANKLAYNKYIYINRLNVL